MYMYIYIILRKKYVYIYIYIYIERHIYIHTLKLSNIFICIRMYTFLFSLLLASIILMYLLRQ